MEQSIKDKIAKVYELVKRGVDGEKEAAKKALDRILKKYNIRDVDFDTLNRREYRFKYATELEMQLLCQIHEYFLDDSKFKAYRDLRGVRELVIELEYIDFVVVDSAYEYFRRHMKKEYNRLVLPEIKRCRTNKTKTKRRKELSGLFFSRYIIASKLYKEHQVEKIDLSKMSQKELLNRSKFMNVEGGQYNTQVTTGLYLEK